MNLIISGNVLIPEGEFKQEKEEESQILILEEMERQMYQREGELLRELHQLRRRLALESEWQ